MLPESWFDPGVALADSRRRSVLSRGVLQTPPNLEHTPINAKPIYLNL